jgi:putative addiction module component (TIGR02574 family)
MLTPSEVRDNALALPPQERARLIDALLQSFDPGERAAVDAAWADEAEARIDAHLRGELRAIDDSDAKRRVGGL